MNRRRPVRIGLAGCGRIARLVHLPTLLALPGARLSAVADADPDRRADAAMAAPAATPCADYRELLELDTDAIVVCLPPALHAEAAAAVLGAGKHLYLEKPLAVSSREAAGVLDTARQTDCVAMMGFNYRFHPLHQALRRRVQRVDPKAIRQVRTVFSSRTPDPPPWKKARVHGGGVLLDLASHHVDLLRFLLGAEVCEVACEVASRVTEEDHACLRLLFTNGVRTLSTFSLTEPDQDTFEVELDDRTLRLDRHRGYALEGLSGHTAALRRLTPFAIRKRLAPQVEPSYKRALSSFVAAAQGARRVLPGLEDGLRSLDVVEAARAEAERNLT